MRVGFLGRFLKVPITASNRDFAARTVFYSWSEGIKRDSFFYDVP